MISSKEEMLALIREMDREEREELLLQLYGKEIISRDEFLDILGVDGEMLAEELSEYREELLESYLEDVSDECLLKRIREDEYGR